ncbi:hypothetical protein [Halomonas shantousis]
MSVTLTACGDSAPSESELIDAVENFLQNDPGRFSLELPLIDTRPQGSDFLLGGNYMTLDYGVLQILSHDGLLRRVNEENMIIRYQPANEDSNLFNVHPGNKVAVLLGTLAPAEVANFTEPSEKNSVQRTLGNVIFKPDYAAWVDEENLEALRGFAAIVSQGPGGDRLATQPFANTLSNATIGALTTALSGSDIFDLQQPTVYWMNLAAQSYEFTIPFVLTNEGWTVESQIYDWEPGPVTGIGNLTTDELREMARVSMASIESSVEKVPPPSHDAIKAALSSHTKGRTITLPTRFNDEGKVFCNAEYIERYRREPLVRYQCSDKQVLQLNAMVEAGHVSRSVPKAGSVIYALRSDLKDYLSDNGQLVVGHYSVESVDEGTVETTPTGFSLYSTTVTQASEPYDWASVYMDDIEELPKTLNVKMVYTGNDWILQSASSAG